MQDSESSGGAPGMRPLAPEDAWMRGDLQREGETLSAERAGAGLAPHPGAGPSANVGGERDYGSCCNGSSAHPRISSTHPLRPRGPVGR